MTKKVRISQTLVNITHGDEFAIISRKPREGKYSITLSIPATPRMANLLDDSGIIEVISYNGDGLIVFERKPFYETHLIIDIVTDILERHNIDSKYENKYRLL